MTWSTDPKVQAQCARRIQALKNLPDLQRQILALRTIERIAAVPYEGGDRPLDYCSALAAYALDPTLP